MTIETWGIIGGILITISLLPQLFKIISTKSSRDVSLIMFIIFAIGELSWIVYAWKRKDWILFYFKVSCFIIAIITIFFIFKYQKTR